MRQPQQGAFVLPQPNGARRFDGPFLAPGVIVTLLDGPTNTRKPFQVFLSRPPMHRLHRYDDANIFHTTASRTDNGNEGVGSFSVGERRLGTGAPQSDVALL